MEPLLGLLDPNDQSMVTLHIVRSYLLTWIVTPFSTKFLNSKPIFFPYCERLEFCTHIEQAKLYSIHLKLFNVKRTTNGLNDRKYYPHLICSFLYGCNYASILTK